MTTNNEAKKTDDADKIAATKYSSKLSYRGEYALREAQRIEKAFLAGAAHARQELREQEAQLKQAAPQIRADLDQLEKDWKPFRDKKLRDAKIAAAEWGAQRFAFKMAHKQAMPLIDPMVTEVVQDFIKRLDGDE